MSARHSSGDIGIPGDQGPGRQHPLPGRSPASFLFLEPGVLRPRLPGRRGSAWRPRWGRGRRGRRWRVAARTSDAAPARPKPGSRRPPRLGRPAPRSTPGLPRALSDCGGRCCSVRRLARSPTSLPARRLSHSAFLSAARSPARGDMAHAPASCPSSQVSGDSEMGKPRKVALITGITGQVSAGRGRAACGLGARGPRPSAGPPRRGELLSARPGRCVRPRGWAGFSPGSVAFCSLWLWALVAHRTALSHLSSGWLWRFFHGAQERAWKEYRTLQSLVPGRKRASDLSIVCGVSLRSTSLTCSSALFGTPAAAVVWLPLTRVPGGEEIIGVTDRFSSSCLHTLLSSIQTWESHVFTHFGGVSWQTGPKVSNSRD